MFTPRRLFLFLAVLSLALTPALLQFKVEASPSATYAHGSLSLNLPYTTDHTGPGRLRTELLDPEDHILAQAERAVSATAGSGSWQEIVTPREPIPLADLVWQRVRYRFTYNDPALAPIELIQPIDTILRRPVVRILGQHEYLAGSQAAIRILVADATQNDSPLTGTVRIDLVDADNKNPKPLFTGRLNQRGTLEAQFRFPAGLTGTQSLRFTAETPIGETEYVDSVTLAEKSSILLTTEKPIYQPGQTIHVRALALDRASHAAAANRPLTFELEDARANKIFRRATTTDAFGIASAEIPLADEVNLGAWHLHALMGDPQNPASTSEQTLQVERYVLPKFKVSVDLTPANGKPKKDFRPGDHVTGIVHANYFFGKPVDHAEITLKLTAMDVEVFHPATAKGTTDAEGAYRFDLKLPTFFAGRPLSQGNARALVEAAIKDSAEHTESRGEPITISQSALLVLAVPESGALVPHLENQIYLIASYPDGNPAANATLTVGQRTLTTAQNGVVTLKLAANDQPQSLKVEADDHHGARASVDCPLQSKDGEDQVLLRTDRAVVKAGERLELTVLSTRQRGTAYVDIIRNGQTILTRDLELASGRATLAVIATPEMAGTLDLDAYVFGRDAQPVADHRLVFVQPAGELRIETTTDAPVYRPGAEAKLRFHVTNTRGQGVSAALGLQIVDEAVFALAEKQPGFAEVFFYLEQQAMKPRYEIHSLSLDQSVIPPSGTSSEDNDLAAQALFSATELTAPQRLEAEFGRTLPQDHAEAFHERYQKAFAAQVTRLASELSAETSSQPTPSLLKRIAESPQAPRDSWGHPLHIEPSGIYGSDATWYRVASAGPDGAYGSADDLVLYLRHERSGSSGIAPYGAGANRNGANRNGNPVAIDHDFGPFNGRAQVTGTLTDATGAIIPQARVALEPTGPGAAPATTVTDARGNFNFDSVQPGPFRLRCQSPGFATLLITFSLAPRDLARIAATLSVAFQNETVTLSADAPAGGRGRAYVLATPPPPKAMPVMMMGGMNGAVRGMAMAAAPMANKAQMQAFDAVEVNALPVESRNATFFAQPLLSKQKSAPTAPAADTGHIRSWFPEALYINPEILTDAHGNAEISIPVADSITTWRMALMASTTSGALGTGTASLKVLQDFFLDLDLPVTLTQGDRVQLPVAIYNYAGKDSQVKLHLEPDPWYTLTDDTADKTVQVPTNHVGAGHFTLTANRIGKFKLTLLGQFADGTRRDIVVREIEVVPNGREQTVVANGTLENAQPLGIINRGALNQAGPEAPNPCGPPVICDSFGAPTTRNHGPAAIAILRPNVVPGQIDVRFPQAALPDATTLFIRLYAGPLSQLVEGMDSLLAMPHGCFEQTSSSTYPNVLALDYMRRTKKLTPEIRAKAEGFIALGYQRLLTFEVPGGGFSWFGTPPANKVLTAYGLMEFHDMAKVAEVDPRLIDRTRTWLIAQQQPDGSWKPDTQNLHDGATDRYDSDITRITAYLAWALAETGYQGPATAHARQYLISHPVANGKADTYTLAVISNFAAADPADHDFTSQSMHALLDARTEQGPDLFWASNSTSFYASGQSASVETTGLATQALLRWGQAAPVTRKALAWIASKKSANGDWGSTQATITALRALLLSTQLGAGDSKGHVEVQLNGKTIQTLDLTAANNDLLHQFVIKDIDPHTTSHVSLRFQGTGSVAYQVADRYYLPWQEAPPAEDLAIAVTYDKTTLQENSVATATATIHNNTAKTANMVMVDLGIPPGFDLLSEDLQTYQQKSAKASAGRLEKFSQTATQAILYFNSLAPNQTIKITYRLRAKYPIKAKTFESKVYEYYNPDIQAQAAPIQLQVTPNKTKA